MRQHWVYIEGGGGGGGGMGWGVRDVSINFDLDCIFFLSLVRRLGAAVRVPDLKSGGPGFKLRPRPRL